MLKLGTQNTVDRLNVDHYVETVLSQYPCHDLAQQEQASLLTRSDEKFVIHIRDLPFLLLAAKDHYSVLSDGHTKLFSYQTEYFDTLEKMCFRQHHNGKSNRFKVRIRQYDDSSTAFLECKIKSNKGYTNKLRRRHFGGLSLASASDFLFPNVGLKSQDLHPVLHVHYYRITLMNPQKSQRITFDLNLTFSQSGNADSHSFSDAVIIEIKQDGKMKRTLFHDVLRRLKYQKSDFSKYCMGCVITGIDGIKYNRFKSNILMLARLRPQAQQLQPSLNVINDGEYHYG